MIVLAALFFGTLLLQACGRRSAASMGPEHIRGTIQSLDDQVLSVATPTGSVRVQLAASTAVALVVPSDRTHLTDGSFLGITSVTGPDGSQRAAEVHVFPDSMRGAGEGSYDWDRPGVIGGGTMTTGTATSSTMTNGTVSSLRMTNGTATTQGDGSALTLQYKKDGMSGGSQAITVPPDIPSHPAPRS
jgi:hypothetical protein